jgi:hypothetical protein
VLLQLTVLSHRMKEDEFGWQKKTKTKGEKEEDEG